MSIHAANTSATRAAVLAHLIYTLRAQPPGTEMVMGGGEVYGLIRWCMLKVEGQRRSRATRDADRLYDTLTAAYERSGAFVGVSRGHAFYDVGALCDAVRDVARQQE